MNGPPTPFGRSINLTTAGIKRHHNKPDKEEEHKHAADTEEEVDDKCDPRKGSRILRLYA